MIMHTFKLMSYDLNPVLSSNVVLEYGYRGFQAADRHVQAFLVLYVVMYRFGVMWFSDEVSCDKCRRTSGQWVSLNHDMSQAVLIFSSIQLIYKTGLYVP